MQIDKKLLPIKRNGKKRVRSAGSRRKYKTTSEDNISLVGFIASHRTTLARCFKLKCRSAARKFELTDAHRERRLQFLIPNWSRPCLT